MAGCYFFFPLLTEAGELCFAVVHCELLLLGGGLRLLGREKGEGELLCKMQESHARVESQE